MRMQRADLAEAIGGPSWSGLHLTIDQAPRPRFRVEAIPPWFLRVSRNDVGLLWARFTEDFYGYDLVTASEQNSPGVVPPISFARARELAQAASATERRRRWASQLADWLRECDATPLHDGDWLIEGVSDSGKPLAIDASTAEAVLQQPRERYIDWDRRIVPILLRRPSAPDHGRVRAWRKLARADALPPIVLYWVTGLAACVVLDGHDRLLAGSLEGVDVPKLVLSRVHVSRPAPAFVAAALSQAERLAAPGQPSRAVDAANALALASSRSRFDDARTRAVPLKGGLARWRAEVRTHAGDSTELLRR